ncbi:MAG: ABC transporter permease [Spirochaetaceae bacterium]|nr:ABC transporter permease [Spirochaetaceae bacterium]
MGLRTIGVLLGREYRDFYKNRTLLIITALGLILFLSLYFIIPGNSSEETLLAVYMESDTPVLSEFLKDKDIHYQSYRDRELFMNDMEDSAYPAGLIITDALWEDLKAGRLVEIPFVIAPDTAEEYVEVLQAYLEIFLNELVLQINDNVIPLSVHDITIGKDSLTEEIPLRRLFIPLIIIMIFVTELLGIGNSLMEEVGSRTITALLAAPVKVSEFLISKSVFAISLLFLESIIVITVTGSLNNSIGYIAVLLISSAFLVSGLSFLLASISKDLMSLVSWGLLMMIILIVPVSGVLFPGLNSRWMSFIPTYSLADGLNKLINSQISFSDLTVKILAMTSYSVLFFSLGLFALRRRIRCL